MRPITPSHDALPGTLSPALVEQAEADSFPPHSILEQPSPLSSSTFCHFPPPVLSFGFRMDFVRGKKCIIVSQLSPIPRLGSPGVSPSWVLP